MDIHFKVYHAQRIFTNSLWPHLMLRTPCTDLLEHTQCARHYSYTQYMKLSVVPLFQQVLQEHQPLCTHNCAHFNANTEAHTPAVFIVQQCPGLVLKLD